MEIGTIIQRVSSESFFVVIASTPEAVQLVEGHAHADGEVVLLGDKYGMPPTVAATFAGPILPATVATIAAVKALIAAAPCRKCDEILKPYER